MSLLTAAPQRLGDPLGLWEMPRQIRRPSPPSGAAFSAGEDLSQAAPGAVWSVDVRQPGALERRALQVRAVEAGLSDAEARLDAVLGSGMPKQAGASFSISNAISLDEPERRLAQALAQASTHRTAPAGASYGLAENLDLEALRAGFNEWIERANRQLLHFVWVDTLDGGQLAARTAVAWNGSVSTTCAYALDPTLISLHQQSFGLAMTSRASTLRAVAKIASMAAKISLVIATPLGPLQALLLAAQFLREIVIPAAQLLTAENKP